MYGCQKCTLKVAYKRDQHTKYYNKGATSFEPLITGDHVIVDSHVSNQWYLSTIIGHDPPRTSLVNVNNKIMKHNWVNLKKIR